MTTEIDSKLLGKVHSKTVRMSQLASTIMRLHPTSENRAKCITEYYDLLQNSRLVRDMIVGRAERKTATWFIRTAQKPVDNCGNQIFV